MQSCGIVKTFHKVNCIKYKYSDCYCDESEGTILKVVYFQNNRKKEGVYKEYFNNGKVYKECNYIDGRRNG